jgi:hypothetical protein
MDKLLNADFSGFAASLSEIVQDPTSNLTAAVLLVALVSLGLLILLVIAIFAISSVEDDEHDEDGTQAETTPTEKRPASEPAPPAPKRPFALLLTLGTWAAIFAVVWMVGGAVTSSSTLCVSCHPANPHTKASDADPHQSTQCVSCHETGGPVAAVTYMVAPRILHFALGAVRANPRDGYSGIVVSAQCSRCHAEQISVTTTNDRQGVRMSHTEPIEAGAQCLDCHTLNAGMVSGRTVGMSPCLRCHDGKKAKSECSSCHTKDVGFAVTPDSPPSPRRAADLIGQPDCGGCHSQKRCDACHGIRMPHTVEFMQHGHARQGVEDLWNNGGRTCGKCHNAQRRPCTKCHADMPAHPTSDWRTNHQIAQKGACLACHDQRAWMQGRDFCRLCHDKAMR